MKTTLTSFVSFLILISSCTSQSDKNLKKFTLQGEINGQDSGIITLSYVSDASLINDTAEIINGKFIIEGKVSEPTLATLRDGNDLELAVVYLESAKMKISIVKDKPLGCKMTGSKTQTEFEVLNKLEEPVYDRLCLLKAEGFIIRDSIKNSKSDAAKLILEKKSEQIDSLWSLTRGKLDPIELKFVLEHQQSFVTPMYLLRLTSRDIISLDSVKLIFNGLEKPIQNSRYGKFLNEDIRKKENTSLGAQAPYFKATDINKQTVTLSQFKGKSVVLLDFWASWCVPCRESIPHLKKVYQKYHSKGLDIIAVSTDMDRKAWIEAINQEGIGMMCNIPVAEKYAEGPSKITNDDIYQNYYYNSIPFQILIDKNGKIISKIEGYSKENEETLDKKLSEIFETK
jgi:peroxiredoxin